MGDRYSTILETFRVAIFDTIPEPLLVLDRNLIVLTANEGFFEQFKVSRAETIGKCVFDLGNRQWNIHELKSLLVKMLPEKSPIKGFQVTHDFPTIGKRTMLVNANEIHSSEFIPLDLILIVFQDVTEKKNWTDFILDLNKNLEISNAELKTFGHSLTHDLRAPVGIIEGFTKMILDDYGFELSGDVKEHMSRVLNSAETMDQMISGLSQLAGLSRLLVNPTTVNLSVIAENVINQLRISEPGRTVDVSVEPDMIERVEPSMFLIVLTNLFKNSWKFTRKQSNAKIAFGVKEENGRKIYFVNDNGIGFDMKNVQKIFEMFQRVHSDKDFEGTGTGLAIVKSIINKHGGEIWADSAIGKGTTIFFTIGSRVE